MSSLVRALVELATTKLRVKLSAVQEQLDAHSRTSSPVEDDFCKQQIELSHQQRQIHSEIVIIAFWRKVAEELGERRP